MNDFWDNSAVHILGTLAAIGLGFYGFYELSSGQSFGLIWVLVAGYLTYKANT